MLLSVECCYHIMSASSLKAVVDGIAQLSGAAASLFGQGAAQRAFGYDFERTRSLELENRLWMTLCP